MKYWKFAIYRRMLAAPVRLLIATLWVGSLWTIGYLAAPTLFATLSDKTLAGTIAGSLFRTGAWLSVFCSAMLLILLSFDSNDIDRKQRKTCQRLIVVMLVCTLVGYFGLHPFMAGLREAAGSNGMTPDARMQFGILHGISSVIYLIQSLLGMALILKIRIPISTSKGF